MSNVIPLPLPTVNRDSRHPLADRGKSSANPINADVRSAIYEQLIWRAFQ